MMRPLRGLREKLVPRASGRVVEIGVGNRDELRYYAGVESVHGIEPDPHMLARARARADEAPAFPSSSSRSGAEALPYDDATFDYGGGDVGALYDPRSRARGARRSYACSSRAAACCSSSTVPLAIPRGGRAAEKARRRCG
jgi:SAM-dependent methyltransferase